jgi:hypothetical protein
MTVRMVMETRWWKCDSTKGSGGANMGGGGGASWGTAGAGDQV